MADQRHDGLLLQFAQMQGDVDSMLTAFFSFMRRKTDFFTGQTSPGQAEKIVLKVCREQSALAERDVAEKKARLAKQQAEVDRRNVEKAARRAAAMKAAEKASSGGAGEDDDDDDMPTLGTSEKAPALPSAVEETPVTSLKDVKPEEAAAAAASAGGAKDGDGDDDEEEKEKGAKPNIGNGGSGPNYEWTQTLKDLVITVPMPLGTRGKDLIVKVTKDYINVGRKGEPALLDGKLHKICRPEELIWTIDDNEDDTGRVVTLELPKKNQMEWWKCIIQGHEEINTQKVEPENSKLDDLDRDTRQTVEKMMFDQRQKAMNKPTSDEMNKQAMLKKFMAQHPEMDFSNVKIS